MGAMSEKVEKGWWAMVVGGGAARRIDGMRQPVGRDEERDGFNGLATGLRAVLTLHLASVLGLLTWTSVVGFGGFDDRRGTPSPCGNKVHSPAQLRRCDLVLIQRGITHGVIGLVRYGSFHALVVNLPMMLGGGRPDHGRFVLA